MLSSVLEYWVFDFLRNLELLKPFARGGNFVKFLCDVMENFFFNVTAPGKTLLGRLKCLS